jgi:hypothetical protein
MSRLFRLLYPVIAMTLAGTGVVGVLVAGVGDWRAIMLAAILGSLLSVPLTILVARGIMAQRPRRKTGQNA